MIPNYELVPGDVVLAVRKGVTSPDQETLQPPHVCMYVYTYTLNNSLLNTAIGITIG